MRKKEYKNVSRIPDNEIESLARCFLPYIREFYESEEGRKAFEEWERKEKEKEKKRTLIK
jgi:ATP-dependent RNA circularization protein (DNA/RNA ligase family)